MRQVFLENGNVRLKEVCQPSLDDHIVLVSVHYSCVSPGTETATISSAQGTFVEKITKVYDSLAKNGVDGTKVLIKERLRGRASSLGYSCSGRVLAVGKKIKNFREGDFVACAGASFAYHADVVAVPENLLVKVSDAKFLPQASMTTLGSIALQGVRRADFKLGETVCVIGLGLLGQMTVQLAKQSGCTVFGVDLIDSRLTLANKLGADKVFNPTTEDIQKEIAFATEHHGVDATIIAAGSKSDEIIQQAMEITRRKGRVVLVGDVGLNMQRNPLYKKEIDFLISCSYGPGRYDTSYELDGKDYPYAYVRWTENRNMQAIVNLIENGKLDFACLSEQVSVDKVEDAYERLQDQKALSIVLDYTENKKAESIKTKTPPTDEPVSFIPAFKNMIRVGVVGAGGFAKIKLMPIVSRIKHVKINAIVDANMSNSLTVSKTYGAAKALANDSQLFTDDLVDAVVIASPHKYHADQILSALQNGKAVFAEKPMVTDFDQLQKLRNFFGKNPKAPVCVDYNRSFAPYIKKIKKVIKKRNSPLMIQYRMNAGFIPKEHWIQSEVGAGRIIGEACHIFDLFYYLTDAKPVAVSVESLNPSSDDLFPTDNFSASISFSDGSVCTLMYTSLGHKELGKERMEVYFDSKAILMDDYKLLKGYGLPTSFDEKTMKADKGHEDLLKTFFGAIKTESQELPISLERLEKVAELTLVIDQLACAGGGVREIAS